MTKPTHHGYPSFRKARCDLSSLPNRSTPNSVLIITIFLSGDVQLNPGPESIYPCGYCERPVTWQHQRAVCCDECSLWYHSDCIELSANRMDLLCHTSTPWICCKCETQNVDNFTYHSFELDVSNQFHVLSNTCISSIPSIDSSFSPTAFSSPKARVRVPSLESTKSNKTTHIRSNNKHNLRVLIVNCQSIRNKTSSLSESIEYTKPDVIIGCESWLAAEHKNTQIFPEGFQSNVYRKDRNKNGGGVFITTHNSLTTSEVDDSHSDCEAVWAEVHTNSKSVLIGSYYRPPNSTVESLEQLSAATQKITNNKDKHLIIVGDFNLPHINWKQCSITPGATQANQHQELINIMSEHSLEQVQMKPTRLNNVLDLYFTNHPSLVKSCDTIPGISDHHMVVVDSELKPKYSKPKRRKVYKYKKADWNAVKSSVKALGLNIVNRVNASVETKWTELKDGLVKIMDDNIPSKLTSKRHNLPWMNDQLRREVNKKHKLMHKAKVLNTTEAWEIYKEQKRTVQRDIRRAHWRYVNETMEKSLEEGNNKTFWKYIKAKRHDNIGVAGIKSNGVLHQDSKDKAELLNKQFKSVFTVENKEDALPPLSENLYPSMVDIKVQEEGVKKLLGKLNTHKANGPDSNPNTLLKNCAEELAPVIANIFQHSLDTGTLPKDWRNANISPVFKKGNKHIASNYRPVSLTSVQGRRRRGGSGGLCPRTFKSGGAQVGLCPPTFGQIKCSNFAISSFFKVKNAKFSWLASLANLTLFVFSEIS